MKTEKNCANQGDHYYWPCKKKVLQLTFFSNHKSKPNKHHTWKKSNLHQIQSQLQMSSLLLSAITNPSQMRILGSNSISNSNENHTFSAITNLSQMSIILGVNQTCIKSNHNFKWAVYFFQQSQIKTKWALYLDQIQPQLHMIITLFQQSQIQVKWASYLEPTEGKWAQKPAR